MTKHSCTFEKIETEIYVAFHQKQTVTLNCELSARAGQKVCILHSEEQSKNLETFNRALIAVIEDAKKRIKKKSILQGLFSPKIFKHRLFKVLWMTTWHRKLQIQKLHQKP